MTEAPKQRTEDRIGTHAVPLSPMTVCRCNSVMEAETVRIRLEAAGIHATIIGAETGVALSYVGAAVGYPQVQVSDADFERACALLHADRQVLQQSQPWTCARCDEPNEAAFEFCWSCNKSREATDPILRADDSGDQSSAANLQATKRLVALLGRLFPATRTEPADRHPSPPDNRDADRD